MVSIRLAAETLSFNITSIPRLSGVFLAFKTRNHIYDLVRARADVIYQAVKMQG
jgi:hypothetical protein